MNKQVTQEELMKMTKVELTEMIFELIGGNVDKQNTIESLNKNMNNQADAINDVEAKNANLVKIAKDLNDRLELFKSFIKREL